VQVAIENIREQFLRAQAGKQSAHTAGMRLNPSLFQYDYLALSTLAEGIAELIRVMPAPPHEAVALDLGSLQSPYRALLTSKGLAVRTLDIDLESGADYHGTAEATGLPDESFDVVLCTQVLEHCINPWQAMTEIRRILKVGGYAIVSVPHVWFYHPHPHDHWRFTQEGLVHLCRASKLEPMTLLAQGGSVVSAFQIANFLLYGAIGRWGSPIFAFLNILGRAGDRMVPNALFAHNFACLMQRCRS
jgi:SAM-dependent methyltransferase